MKKILLFISIFAISINLIAQPLGIIESNNFDDINNLSSIENIKIHFYKNNFAIISGKYSGNLSYSKIEENGFDPNYNYYFNSVGETLIPKLKSSLLDKGEILFNNKSFAILKVKKDLAQQFIPVNKHSLVYFDNSESSFVDNKANSFLANVTYSQEIADMISEIEQDSIENTISYLSNFGTRDCYSQQIIEALEWINSKFRTYELDVTNQDLNFYLIPSYNVIAIQEGTTNPDEFVVVGGHADSRSRDQIAPGADDNASGTAGVLEIARILSKKSFDRTIIYCAFSGEEYGLYGSKLFANQYRKEGKNIIAYVNLDMIGYKEQTQSFHTSLIYPVQAKPLADYYKIVTSTYISGFNIENGTLIGGDSDHTSFNNAGYMGIFPFEDDTYHSPYIHTKDDVLGLSVNSLELAEKFTGAALATVASLASADSEFTSNHSDLISNSFSVYPNPAQEYIKISFDSQQKIHVEIFNILGKMVLNRYVLNNETIDISELKQGSYFIKFNSQNQTEVKKVIINR